MPVFVTGMSIIILFYIRFLSNIFYSICADGLRQLLLHISWHILHMWSWYCWGMMEKIWLCWGLLKVGMIWCVMWWFFLGGWIFPCLPWLRCPICGDLSTALDLCLHFCCFDVHSVALSCSFWTSDVSLATSKSNLSWFLAPFGLLTCPSPPRSPTPTI